MIYEQIIFECTQTMLLEAIRSKSSLIEYLIKKWANYGQIARESSWKKVNRIC